MSKTLPEAARASSSDLDLHTLRTSPSDIIFKTFIQTFRIQRFRAADLRTFIFILSSPWPNVLPAHALLMKIHFTRALLALFGSSSLIVYSIHRNFLMRASVIPFCASRNEPHHKGMYIKTSSSSSRCLRINDYLNR